MGKTKQPAYFKTKTFLTSLQQIIKMLPTESEKQESQQRLNVLIEFLNNLRNSLAIVPSSDNMSDVSRSIQALEDLIKKVETDQSLASILGLRVPSAVRKDKVTLITEEEKARAKAALNEIESLPIDEIRARLQSETLHSVSELNAIASLLGIRSIKKIKRESLAHQIAMKIANYRGYQRLSGQVKD